MANNCYNYAVLSGDMDAIMEIKKHFDTYDLFTSFTDFGNSMLGKNKVDTYAYGTKWWSFDIELDGGELQIFGDSACSPPIELMKELNDKYGVSVLLSYSEPGMDFSGTLEISEGGEVFEEEHSYQMGLIKRGGINEFIESYEGHYDDIDDFLYCVADDVKQELGIKKLKELWTLM